MKTDPNIFHSDELIVTYNPRICQQSETCCKGLSEVFRSSVIPWIDLEAAKTLQIINQVNKCPSGALSYSYAEKMELVK